MRLRRGSGLRALVSRVEVVDKDDDADRRYPGAEAELLAIPDAEIRANHEDFHHDSDHDRGDACVLE